MAPEPTPEHGRDRPRAAVHVGGGRFRNVSPEEAEALRAAREDQDHEEHRPRGGRHTLHGLLLRPAGEAELREAVERSFVYRGDVSLLLDDESVLIGFVFDRRDETDLADCMVRLIPTQWKADPQQRLSVPYARIKAIKFTGRDPAQGLAWEVWRDRKTAVPPPTDTQEPTT
jgi:hypothetical protein